MTEGFITKKWGTLFALMAVFVIPFGGAWYYYRHGGLPRAGANQGELVEPLIRMTDIAAYQSNGREFPKKSFYGKWRLLLVVPKACKAQCQDNLYKIQQVHIALHKDAVRVQRLVATLGQPTPVLSQLLRERYKGIPLLSFNKVDFQRMTQGYNWQTRVFREGGIYIVDPQAYVMMIYRLDQGPKAIHHDLKRLLKVSQVG